MEVEEEKETKTKFRIFDEVSKIKINEKQCEAQLQHYLKLLDKQIDKARDPKASDEITESMIKLLVFMTYRLDKFNQILTDYFEPNLDWDSYESGKDFSKKMEKRLFWFVKLCEGMPLTGCCKQFRNVALNHGITINAAHYITSQLPGLAKMKKKERAALLSTKKALPWVLKTLTGLCKNHENSQEFLRESRVIKPVHAMEGVSTTNAVGPLAENLLEASCEENEKLRNYVKILRAKVTKKKKRKALKRRRKMLDEMRIVKVPKLSAGEDAGSNSHSKLNSNVRLISNVEIAGEKELQEETGLLKCMICREGYTCAPNKLLGIYAYNKSVDSQRSSVLGKDQGDPLTDDLAVSTVSHFNLIHFECHRKSKIADLKRKNALKEWAGATLRNSRTTCNNIFPVVNRSLNDFQYSSEVEQYWVRIVDMLGADRIGLGQKFEMLLDDLRMLLKRFSHKASFSEDCKGGGPVSNMEFVPYMTQMLVYLYNKETPSAIQKRVVSVFQERMNQKLFNVADPGVCDVEFVVDTCETSLLLCLLFLHPGQWREVRYKQLKQLLRNAWRQPLIEEDDETEGEDKKESKNSIIINTFGLSAEFPLQEELTEENAPLQLASMVEFIRNASDSAVKLMHVAEDGAITKVNEGKYLFSLYEAAEKKLTLHVRSEPDGFHILQPWWHFWLLIDKLHGILHNIPLDYKPPSIFTPETALKTVTHNLTNHHTSICRQLSEELLTEFRQSQNESSDPFKYLGIKEMDENSTKDNWIRRCLGLENIFPDRMLDSDFFLDPLVSDDEEC